MIFNEWLPPWEQRADADQPVQVGSSLAADDVTLPMLPSSQQAWIGIFASIDHLLALKALWGAAGELNAFAANALLRSSVLTASTAVYLLDDSPGVTRQERQRRAALAAVTDFRDALRYHDVIQPMADGLGEEAAQAHDRTRVALVDRLTRAEETAKAKGATANQVRSGLQAYRCVQAAADLLSRDTHDPLHVTTGLMYVWQQGTPTLTAARGRWSSGRLARRRGSPRS